jgi:hypothetical protein
MMEFVTARGARPRRVASGKESKVFLEGY